MDMAEQISATTESVQMSVQQIKPVRYSGDNVGAESTGKSQMRLAMSELHNRYDSLANKMKYLIFQWFFRTSEII